MDGPRRRPGSPARGAVLATLGIFDAAQDFDRPEVLAIAAEDARKPVYALRGRMNIGPIAVADSAEHDEVAAFDQIP